jgi:succinate dehydrogenase / fumarate reductase cytochrome b subunit
MTGILRPFTSSIGSKVVVAVTGLLLTGFVLAHLAGNLLIFLGRDWLNAYAHHLKSLGGLLWVARGGLLVIFLVHMAVALRLSLANRQARPERYVHEEVMQATWASRNMALTGLVLLAFVAFHLAHFTAGLTHNASTQYDGSGKALPLQGPRSYLDLTDALHAGSDGVKSWAPETGKRLSTIPYLGEEYRHDVYSMVVNGFRDPVTSLTYLIAMAFLGLHLWHGGSSMLQTLGLNGRAWFDAVSRVGPVIACLVVAGNCAIVLSVWLGVVG